MKFSVVIPVRKITDFLKESISKLKELDYADFEVIIVTDVAEAYDFAGDRRFILIDSGGSGNPCIKRNLAVKKSSGDIVVFLDDDAYPSKSWLKEAAQIFADPKVYALGGPAITPTDAVFLERMSGYVLESWMASGGTTYRHRKMTPREIDDYPTVNLFVRKNAFESVGGFILDFWPGEDTKLCLDLVKKFGRKFLYNPKPVVYHHRRNLFRPHLKQISRYGKHRGQFARLFPENSLRLSYFIPSLFLVGLVLVPFLFLIFPIFKTIYFLVLGVYLGLLVGEGAKISIKEKSLLAGLYVATGIFITHVIYGTNFIIGFIKKPRLKLKAVDVKSGNYSEG